MNSESTKSDSNACRRILLVHGLGSHRVFMWPLAWYLTRNGFVVTNFGYRSFWRSIEYHAQSLTEEFDRLQCDPSVDSFAVVGHSMGGIITRQAILNGGNSGSFSKLKRVVQLGSPNRGSPAARRLGYLLPFCKTLCQISDAPDSFVNRLPPPEGDVEFGVIAGQYDLVVSKRSSHLSTEKDHVSIFSGHNGLLVRPRVLKQVSEFLTYGRFSK